MTLSARGIFFVIVGPGGAGKDTMMNRVFAQVAEHQGLPLERLVTATTRPPRPGERDRFDYFFKTHAEFEQMIADNQLVEYQQVTSGNYYGVPRDSVDPLLAQGTSVMGDVDVLGARRILEEYPTDAVVIFVTVGDAAATTEERLNILRSRMQQRQDRPEAIEERIERARSLEFPFQPLCHHTIYNEDIGTATQQLWDIITETIAARQKVTG
jgi:guanylate kinase